MRANIEIWQWRGLRTAAFAVFQPGLGRESIFGLIRRISGLKARPRKAQGFSPV
jgi:hypothetical protein